MAADGHWCDDDLPYSFVMDSGSLFIVRMNQKATCTPQAGETYVCKEKWPGFAEDTYEVNAKVNDAGNLVFANKGEQPITYQACSQ